MGCVMWRPRVRARGGCGSVEASSERDSITLERMLPRNAPSVLRTTLLRSGPSAIGAGRLPTPRVNEQHRDIRRRNAGDARRLADRSRLPARELLARLAREPGQLARPERRGERRALERHRLVGALLLARDVATIAGAHLEARRPLLGEIARHTRRAKT